MLIFLDLETTGLSPIEDVILEVAVIATDDKFNELGRYQAVSDNATRINLRRVDPFVIDMHASNGLWVESMKSSRIMGEIDADLARWVANLMTGRPLDHQTDPSEIKERLGENIKKLQPQLAGSTIGFDREFMRYGMPETLSLLNYRNLDVSSLNEMAKRFWPSIWEGRPRGGATLHRAMPDIENSLANAAYYSTALGGQWNP
jgi:oligoribonuclease